MLLLLKSNAKYNTLLLELSILTHTLLNMPIFYISFIIDLLDNILILIFDLEFIGTFKLSVG